jgi:hypothetical protein
MKVQENCTRYLKKWMISFKSYFILKDYGNSRKVKIVNATPNSFIDAFDKVDFP